MASSLAGKQAYAARTALIASPSRRTVNATACVARPIHSNVRHQFVSVPPKSPLKSRAPGECLFGASEFGQPQAPECERKIRHVTRPLSVSCIIEYGVIIGDFFFEVLQAAQHESPVQQGVANQPPDLRVVALSMASHQCVVNQDSLVRIVELVEHEFCLVDHRRNNSQLYFRSVTFAVFLRDIAKHQKCSFCITQFDMCSCSVPHHIRNDYLPFRSLVLAKPVDCDCSTIDCVPVASDCVVCGHRCSQDAGRTIENEDVPDCPGTCREFPFRLESPLQTRPIRNGHQPAGEQGKLPCDLRSFRCACPTPPPRNGRQAPIPSRTTLPRMRRRYPDRVPGPLLLGDCSTRPLEVCSSRSQRSLVRRS